MKFISKLRFLLKNNENSSCFNYYIHTILVCFKLCGWNPLTESGKKDDRHVWTYSYKILFLLHFLMLIMPLAFFPYFCYDNWGNFEEILLQIIVIIVNNIGMAKMLTIVMHGNKIRSVLLDIQRKFWNFENDDVKKDFVLKTSKLQKKIIYIYLITFSLMIVLMLARPAFSKTYSGLPFPNSISFLSMDNKWCFSVLYLAQILDCLFTVCNVIAFDGMLLSFAMQISAEINNIIKIIQQLGCNHTYNAVLNIHRDSKLLQIICDDYNFLLNVVRRIEIIYSNLITTNLILLTLYFCSCLYLINTNYEINYTHFIAAICGLAVLTFNFASGQFITNKFEELYSTMLYSRWTNLVVPQKKVFILLILMTQQNVYLRASFCDVLITTFGRILHNAYSFYTVVRTMTK